MRVIAGTAKRIPLKTVEGMETRPTTDRIKETLFNMLQYQLADCTFLDLFSGSGAIGIEALSRGAKKCIFVEKNPRAIACIEENLKATKLEQKAIIMNSDVVTALNRLESSESYFDFIFLDPPYHEGLEHSVLEHLSTKPYLDKQSTIVIEADLDTDFSYIEEMGYIIENEKKYKTNKHVFLYRGEL